MKKLLFPISLLTLGLVLLPGCAWTKRQLNWQARSAKTAQPQSGLIVTPDESHAAKVLSVNTVGRFVVLNFPEGTMPKLDQHLFLYRGGLKTAEVKVVGPQMDTFIDADILSGEADVGEMVRDQ